MTPSFYCRNGLISLCRSQGTIWRTRVLCVHERLCAKEERQIIAGSVGTRPVPGLRRTFPGPYFQRTLTKIKYNFQVDYMCRRSLHSFPPTRRADFNFYGTYNRSASFSFYPLKIQGFWVEQVRSLGGPRLKNSMEVFAPSRAELTRTHHQTTSEISHTTIE